MIAKTKTLKKMIFFPTVLLSSFFTALLFYQFGSNKLTSILFVIAGISIQLYQVMCLREWKNAQLIKSKHGKKYVSLGMYLFITISSCVATITFGMKEIDRRINSQQIKLVDIEILKQKIDTIESRADKKQREEKIATLRRSINALQSQIPNITYDISKRTIEINNEIRKMNNEIDSIINYEIDEEASSELYGYKKELAIKESEVQDVKGSFDVIADALRIKTKIVMLVFLVFVTLSIESIIYSTGSTVEIATQGKEKQKKKRIKKYKDIIREEENMGQLRMIK